MERSHPAQPVPAHGAPAAPGGHGGAMAVPETGHPKASLYVGIFAILFVVTAAEVAVTYFPAIPQLPALLILAVLKFGLIAAFYMHLKFDSRVFSAFFITGLILATGMLFSLLALFAAHYREPFDPATAQQTPTSGAGAAAAPTAAARH
jgi:cytochrome c oxidase subunit 4